MNKIIVLLLSSAFIFINSANAQHKFELADYGKMASISDPQISPDGKSILLLVSRPNYEQNLFNTQLVLVEVETRNARVIQKNKYSLSHPRWSPDGKQIAFIAKMTQDKSAVLQLFLTTPLVVDKAAKITSTIKGIQHFSWGPNSESIAYVTADEPVNKKEIEKGITAFEVGNNDMFITSKPATSHIWLANLKTGVQKRLTSGEWSLPVTIPPGAPSSPLCWSPDGNSILFIKVTSPYSGESANRTIQVLNIKDGSFAPLTTHAKLESYPSFSPDGKTISYWYKKDSNPEDINEMWITDKQGNDGKIISATMDKDLYRTVWMPDGKNLLVGGHDDNKTSLWTLGTDGNFNKINLGSVCPSWFFWIELSVSNNGRIAFVGSEPNHPSELYFLSSTSSKPERLSNFNKEVSEMTLGKTETIRWETEGWKHCGIVTYPTKYDSNKKYPIVLIIHGGPFAASVDQFSRLSQLFSNEGYFVFEPNYRGSDNSGSKYRLAIVSDAGEGPGKDIMDGLAVLKRFPAADSNKIGVTGWSYGGFMTVWLSGHFSGWSAAIAGAAVTDLSDQYNLGDYSINRALAMGGSPWVGDNMQRYIDQSPITEARKIKAPTLILANIGDPRVPITQSYKLFHALKDNGTVAKFIVWPINAHNASDPVTQMERDRYWLGWMNQYLK